MGRFDENRKKTDRMREDSVETFNNMRSIQRESLRVANTAHNIDDVIDDLDRKFAQATQLSSSDFAFLFLSVALQCVRHSRVWRF